MQEYSMWNRFKGAWRLYKDIRAAEGLLRLFGFWNWMAAGGISVGLTIWGYLQHLASPLLVSIALGAFAFVLLIAACCVLIWRASQPVVAGPTMQGFGATVEHKLIKGRPSPSESEQKPSLLPFPCVAPSIAIKFGQQHTRWQDDFELETTTEELLHNVTIETITVSPYTATFNVLDFLKKGQPEYLFPIVEIDKEPNTRGDMLSLMQAVPHDLLDSISLRVYVTGTWSRGKFRIPYIVRANYFRIEGVSLAESGGDGVDAAI